MHPEAFKIFGVSIYWYGILAAIGFLTGFWTATRRAPRENLSKEAIMNLAPWIIFGALIGARLFYVINYWDQEFAGRPLHRIITIGRHEARLTAARTTQTDPAWQADYRATRPKVERKIAHLTRRRHGGRRARMRGITKITADFKLLAAAINLARMATLRLTHRHATGWAAA